MKNMKNIFDIHLIHITQFARSQRGRKTKRSHLQYQKKKIGYNGDNNACNENFSVCAG